MSWHCYVYPNYRQLVEHGECVWKGSGPATCIWKILIKLFRILGQPTWKLPWQFNKMLLQGMDQVESSASLMTPSKHLCKQCKAWLQCDVSCWTKNEQKRVDCISNIKDLGIHLAPNEGCVCNTWKICIFMWNVCPHGWLWPWGGQYKDHGTHTACTYCGRWCCSHTCWHVPSISFHPTGMWYLDCIYGLGKHHTLLHINSLCERFGKKVTL